MCDRSQRSNIKTAWPCWRLFWRRLADPREGCRSLPPRWTPGQKTPAQGRWSDTPGRWNVQPPAFMWGPHQRLVCCVVLCCVVRVHVLCVCMCNARRSVCVHGCPCWCRYIFEQISLCDFFFNGKVGRVWPSVIVKARSSVLLLDRRFQCHTKTWPVSSSARSTIHI